MAAGIETVRGEPAHVQLGARIEGCGTRAHPEPLVPHVDVRRKYIAAERGIW